MTFHRAVAGVADRHDGPFQPRRQQFHGGRRPRAALGPGQRGRLGLDRSHRGLRRGPWSCPPGASCTSQTIGLPAASAARPRWTACGWIRSVRAKEISAVAWTTRRTICRAAGIGRAPIAKLPVDDLVAPPLDGRASRGQRPSGCHRRRREPLHHQVLQRRIVFQRGQQFQHNLREAPAALVQQGGNIHRHVLAGIEKIGHQHDPPHAREPPGRHLVGNVGPGDGKEGRQRPRPRRSREAIRSTMATKPWFASARGLPWLMIRMPSCRRSWSFLTARGFDSRRLSRR